MVYCGFSFMVNYYLCFRLMIECRYSKISPTMMRATAGYVVVSPSVPASVTSDGLYAIQLRITDGRVFLQHLILRRFA